MINKILKTVSVSMIMLLIVPCTYATDFNNLIKIDTDYNGNKVEKVIKYKKIQLIYIKNLIIEKQNYKK